MTMRAHPLKPRPRFKPEFMRRLSARGHGQCQTPVVVNIKVANIDEFRRSRSDVQRDIAAAVKRGRRAQ